MVESMWSINQFNSIYYIKMERILRYNVLFNHYRVFLQSSSTVLLLSIVFSSALQSVDEFKS